MTGEPSYIELGVQDPPKARAFYGALLGWPAGGGFGRWAECAECADDQGTRFGLQQARQTHKQGWAVGCARFCTTRVVQKRGHHPARVQ